eukprot:6924825-Prymnesium_polylepis.1
MTGYSMTRMRNAAPKERTILFCSIALVHNARVLPKIYDWLSSSKVGTPLIIVDEAHSIRSVTSLASVTVTEMLT